MVGALEWGWSLQNMPIGTRALKLRVAYLAALASFPDVRLYWVKGHANIIYNEVVENPARRKRYLTMSTDWGGGFHKVTPIHCFLVETLSRCAQSPQMSCGGEFHPWDAPENSENRYFS